MKDADLLQKIKARCIEDGGCLIWPGAMADGNCPHMRNGRKYVNVRRFLYEQTTGPIPQGMLIAVTCECKRCLRHVAPMTTQQVRQKVADQGVYAPAIHGPKVAAGWRRAGVKHPEDVIREIRASDESGAALARRLNVSESHVSKIRRGAARKDYSNPFAGLGA